MVTLTQTLLSLFGSRVVLPKTGILMNNGINWFDPTGGPNGIAPGRKALSNYCPAIMTGGGEAIAIGGGRKIIPAVFQILALCSDFGMTLDEAFHQPSTCRGSARWRPTGGSARRPSMRSRRSSIRSCEPVPYPFPFTIASACAA